VRKQARRDQAAAVDDAVARTLAGMPETVEAPQAPAEDPEPAMDPIFDTCTEAGDNGFGNYVDGVDPEYGYYDDADGDGVVCE
jgi:hypothetical protein